MPVSRSYRLLCWLINKQQLPSLFPMCSQFITLLFLDLLLLTSYSTPSSMSQPVLDYLNNLDPILLLVCMIVVSIALMLFNRKITFSSGLHLVCVYRGVQGVVGNVGSGDYGSLALYAVMLVLMLLLVCVSVAQNIDDSYCTQDFLAEFNNSNKLYFKGAQLAIVVMRITMQDARLFVGISGIMLLLACLQRMNQPYYNQTLQHSQVVLYGVSFCHAVLVFAFMQDIPPETYILVTIFTAFFFFGVSYRLQVYREEREHEITEKYMLQSLPMALRLFRRLKPNTWLKNYCVRVNRYIEYERITEFNQLQEEITIANRKDWTELIYEVSTRHINVASAGSHLLLNCAYYEMYVRRNWIKALQHLNRLKQIFEQQRTSLQLFFNRIIFHKAQSTLTSLFKNLSTPLPQIPYPQFLQISSIVSSLISICDSYSQIWDLLSHRQVFIDRVINNVDVIMTKIERVNREVKKLQFKSNYLQRLLVGFDHMVRLDVGVARERLKQWDRNVTTVELGMDMKDFVFAEVGLNRENIGEFIRLGANQGMINPLGVTNKMRKMNVSDIVPQGLAEYHYKLMTDFVYKDKPIQDLSPFKKTTYCLIQGFLNFVNIYFKFCLFQYDLRAIGFMKINKHSESTLILCQANTGIVVAVSEQFSQILEAMEAKQKVRFRSIRSFMPQIELENVKIGSAQEMTLDLFSGREDLYVVECFKATEIDGIKLACFEIRRKNMEFSPRMTVKHLFDLFVNNDIENVPEYITTVQNTSLPNYFTTKSQITTDFPVNKNRVIYLIIIILGLLIISFKFSIYFVDHASNAFYHQYLYTISNNTRKDWLTRRMYLQFQATMITKTGLYNVTTTSSEDLTETLMMLSKTNKELESSHLPSDTITVNIQGTKLYQLDSFLWLSEALSKSLFLSEMPMMPMTPLQRLQLNTSLTYLFQNKNFPVLDAVGDYKINVEAGNRKYLAYHACMASFIILFALILTFLIINLQVNNSRLKRKVCQALFIIQSQDLLMFRQTIYEFLCQARKIQTNTGNDYNTKADFYKNRSLKEPTSRQFLSSDLSTNRFLHARNQSIMTQDDVLRSYRENRDSKIHRNSGTSMPEEFDNKVARTIFNKPAKCNTFVVIAFVLISALICAQEIQTIVDTRMEQIYKINLPAQQDVIAQTSISFTTLVELFTTAIIENKFSLALLNNQIQVYRTARTNLAQYYNTQPDGPLKSQLSLILYTKINQYYTVPATYSNLNSTLDNLIEGLQQQMQNIFINSSNRSVVQPFISYIVWFQRMYYEIYRNLSDEWMDDQLDRSSAKIWMNSILAYSAWGLIALLILLSVVYAVYSSYSSRKYFKVLDLLSTENFKDVKKSTANIKNSFDSSSKKEHSFNSNNKPTRVSLFV